MFRRERCLSALVAIGCLAVAIGDDAFPAWAHGAAQWIADGGFKAPSGSMCCGPTDCRRAAGAVTRRVADGYLISVTIDGKAYQLFTPKAAVFASIDDAVWYCALPPDYLAGHARCLFLPRTV